MVPSIRIVSAVGPVCAIFHGQKQIPFVLVFPIRGTASDRASVMTSFWLNYWWLLLLILIGISIAIVFAFASWMRTRPDIDLQTGAKCWDTFVKLISAFTAIAAGSLVVVKYFDQRAQTEEQQIRFEQAKAVQQRLMFEVEEHRRRELFFAEAAQTAARIAFLSALFKENGNTITNEGDSKTELYKSLLRFEELYHADLIGLEGVGVAKAMICFRNSKRMVELNDAIKEADGKLGDGSTGDRQGEGSTGDGQSKGNTQECDRSTTLFKIARDLKQAANCELMQSRQGVIDTRNEIRTIITGVASDRDGDSGSKSAEENCQKWLEASAK